MLEMGQFSVHWVAGADPAQTAQGEVVVEDQSTFRVMETLHILTRLCVVSTSVKKNIYFFNFYDRINDIASNREHINDGYL